MSEESSSNGGGQSTGSMIAGIGGIINSVMTTLGNRKFMKDAAVGNRKWEYRMWNENNLYNSPIEQRKRLLAAGYNPQLALGNAVHNTSDMARTSPQAPLPAFDVSGPMNNIVDLEIKQKQMKLMDEQIKNINARTYTEQFKAASEDLNWQHSAWDLRKKDELEEVYYELVRENLRKAQADNTQTEIENTQLPERHQAMVNESAARVRQLSASATGQEIQNQINAEVAKWQRMGMQSGQVAQMLISLMHLIKPSRR